MLEITRRDAFYNIVGIKCELDSRSRTLYFDRYIIREKNLKILV